ncbi:hypothetical protein CYCD_01550 [Tenuifilaceae bacterium CYCD]|nr:hypothetical protein CYCD_01550 [Tenuifilaceae bacterium CYCD]
MSELFNTLVLELGERIAHNCQVIASNQNEIYSLSSESMSGDFSTRLFELIEINKRLQVENKEFLILQLRLRSLLRNINRATLLKIEETSGFWIDEATENYILSKNSESINGNNAHYSEILDPLRCDFANSNGMVFDFRHIKFNNVNMPENLIEQFVLEEKYEICSILINSHTSRN